MSHDAFKKNAKELMLMAKRRFVRHLRSPMAPKYCSEAAVRTCLVSDRILRGLLLWRLSLIVREKLGMLYRQGHVRGDVAYAS